MKINDTDTTNIKKINDVDHDNLTRINDAFIPPNIVTGNLQLLYDFTNPACYNGSGTPQDLTTNNRDITWVNAPTWNDKYFTFDGVNDYGTIDNISSVNTSGSVSYWFRLTDTMNGATQSRRISGINADWEFGRLDPGGTNFLPGSSCTGNLPLGSIGADLGGPNVNGTSTTNWPNTDWFNLVIVWDGVANTSRMYVNNVLERTCGPLGNLSRTGTWTIGRSPGNTSQYFKGDIGWMAYYSAALSASNIEINWNATKRDYGY